MIRRWTIDMVDQSLWQTYLKYLNKYNLTKFNSINFSFIFHIIPWYQLRMLNSNTLIYFVILYLDNANKLSGCFSIVRILNSYLFLLIDSIAIK